jgi:hypothetical protein
MSFFAKYPKINYDLFSDGSIFELTDISRSVIINSNRIADDSALYTYYSINDGDRPDIVSHKLYEDSSYYWTFFIINDFLRDGYTSSWPLSYRNFTKMIEQEYTKYSALSIKPTTNPQLELDGTGFLDMSFIPVTSQYLPYLKFVSGDGEYRSNFIRYDAKRHQCIIADIHKVIDSKRIEVSSRETFVESTNHAYKIVWDDSVRELNLSSTDTEAIILAKRRDAEAKNITLKAEWIDSIYSMITPYDITGTREHISAKTTKEDYILSKTLMVAKPEFRWSDYSNAAYEYYSPNDTVLSAYDALTNDLIVNPKLTSFFEYETAINESKRMIRVIRSEFISEFSDAYFNTINDVT